MPPYVFTCAHESQISLCYAPCLAIFKMFAIFHFTIATMLNINMLHLF